MEDTLRELIDQTLSGTISLESAKARAVASETPKEQVIAEIRTIALEVDQLRGTNIRFEIVASELLWAAACDISDMELRAILAHNLGRSLIYVQEPEAAAPFLEIAEELVRKRGDRAVLGNILGTSAGLHLARGDSAAALAAFTVCNTLARERQDDVAEAASALGIGQILLKQNNPAGAIPWLRRARELCQSLDQGRDEFHCLRLIAQSLDSATQAEEKTAIFVQAAALAGSNNIDPSDSMHVLADLAALEVRLKRLDQAARHFAGALQIAEQSANRMLEGFLAGNLGAVYAMMDRPEDARPLLERALRIAREQDDQDGVAQISYNLRVLDAASPRGMTAERKATSPAQSESSAAAAKSDGAVEKVEAQLIELARQVRRNPQRASKILSTLPPADMTAEQASALAERVLDRVDQTEEVDKHLAYSLALTLEQWLPEGAAAPRRFRLYQTLGIYAYRSNDMERAIDAHAVACTIARDNQMTLQFLAAATNLGSLLRQMGKIHDSLAVYTSAIDAIEEDTPPEHAAMVLVNAATAYADLALHQPAKELTARAIDVLVNQPNQGLPLAMAYTNHAGACFALSELDGAETAINKALELTRREGIRAQEGVALGHLGLIRFGQGRMADAFRYLQTAARIAEDARDLWNAQHWHRDLGNYYLWTHDHVRAQDHFERALAFSRDVHDSRSQAQSLLGLGIAKVEVSPAEALTLFQQAWELAAKTENRAVAVEVAARIAKAQLARAIDLEGIKGSLLRGDAADGAKGAVKNPAALVEARQWVERAHAISPPGEESPDPRLVSAEAKLLLLEGKTNDALAQLTRALQGVHDPLHQPYLHHEIASIYFTTLRSPKAALPHFDQCIDGFDRIADSLSGTEQRSRYRDEHALLFGQAVECALNCGDQDRAFRYSERSRMSELRRLWALRGQASPEIPAFADVSRSAAQRGATAVISFMPSVDKTFVFINVPPQLGESKVLTIDAVDFSFLGLLWMQERASYDQANSADSAARTAWHSTIDNICSQLGSRLLAPVAKALESCPVREIVFVPHSILHCFPLHAAPLKDAQTWGDRYEITYAPSAAMLLHAWSISPKAERDFVGFADSHGDLPMARFELQFAATASNSSGGQCFYGNEVTRERVISSIPHANIIHFACHARQILDDSLSTGISLAPGPSGQEELLDLYTIGRDVILKKDTTVILSACESGTITPRLSSELASIAGGFMAAGARTVIATIWRVRDDAAALFFYHFYKLWLEQGIKPSEALRATQLWMREMNESQANVALQTLIRPDSDTRHYADKSVLARFAACRTDHRPFSRAGDWAAFFITGAS